MYEIGQLIHYGSTGVCRVVEIKPMDFSGKGKEQLYYVLAPLYQNCTISTPVEGGKVFMRPIISREEADALIDQIPDIQAEAYHSKVLRQLSEHYEASLKTHNCADLMELTMSIYAKKQDRVRENKKFGAIDGRFMKRAEELLFGELSAALGIPVDQVQDYIAARLAATTDVPAEA